MCFNPRKACLFGLKMLGDCVLTTVKRVVRLQSFGKCVLTTAKCVEGMQNFRECVLTNVKRVGGLQIFGESAIPPKACRKLAEFWSVRFDHRNTCQEASRALVRAF